MNEERYREAEASFWSSLSLEPTERFVHLDSTGSPVRVLEVGEGTPTLFVHGATAGATSWATLAAALPERRCILVDRPGVALSPAPPPMTEFADFDAAARRLVPEILDGVGVDEADLVVTSLGASIGLRSVAAAPARVRRICALGYCFGAPAEGWPLMMRMTGMRRTSLAMTRIPPSKGMVKAMLGQLGLRDAIRAGRFSAEAIAWFQSLVRDTDTMRNELTVYPPMVELRRGLAAEAELPQAVVDAVSHPVLFLWGTADPFGGADVARRFTSRFAHADLRLIEGAGHAPWMDDGPGCAELIRQHLQT
ncbi:MAG: alpha/beta hydrolase [Actinomycetota bacterium]